MDFNLFKRKAAGFECLGPSVVAEASTFENSCNLNLWMATRFKSPSDDISLAKWQLKHTAVLNKLNRYLQTEYPSSEIDVEFPLQSISLCGNVLFGTPDVVVKFPDGRILVADAKSGKKKQTHWIQVGLYAIMIQAFARSNGQPIPEIYGFALCYSDSSPFSISKKNIEFQTITGKNCLEEVLPEPTRERIRTILNISSNEEMPAPKPSSSNCRFCKWRSGCAESFDPSDSLAVDASDLL